jgi:glycosyltransferase involved in cell wall biosynthesis
MKIALFVPSWPPGNMANGIVTYAAYLVPALRRIGHEVHLLTFHCTVGDKDPWTIDLQQYSPRTTVRDRVKFWLYPATASFERTSARIAAAVHQLVESEKLDVLEMEESFGWSFAVSRLNLLPVVVRLHGPWFLNGQFEDPEDASPINRLRQEREGRAIENAQIITSPSANVMRTVKDHYSLNSINGSVIPNPIQAAAEGDTWNLATCCRDNLLFVGRIDKRKGADLVLRALAALAERYPRLRLTLVGPDNGIKDSGGGIYHFEEFVRANIPESFRPRIKFLGTISHRDIMSLRTKCYATIIASRYEILPYSVLEAMSLGCPLIATAVGGIPELITDHRNGLLFPSDDLEAMTSACEKLLCDAELAARLGRQAWRDCRDFYGPENIAKQTIAAYQRAVEAFKFRGTR